ncbi:unnamed protein product [Didymodactylos carnosus]|uniref:Uncharacterized protein n=1 Tax=Didymodactylos carnosus TaxID=1234261 RepID=A0A815Y073_9BILA|nr:unnamed protein product [Didymodactylos carnosus]CAF4425979.1 unnamed protein product [Didymodactylos carnosus]
MVTLFSRKVDHRAVAFDENCGGLRVTVSRSPPLQSPHIMSSSSSRRRYKSPSYSNQRYRHEHNRRYDHKHQHPPSRNKPTDTSFIYQQTSDYHRPHSHQISHSSREVDIDDINRENLHGDYGYRSRSRSRHRRILPSENIVKRLDHSTPRIITPETTIQSSVVTPVQKESSMLGFLQTLGLDPQLMKTITNSSTNTTTATNNIEKSKQSVVASSKTAPVNNGNVNVHDFASFLSKSFGLEKNFTKIEDKSKQRVDQKKEKSPSSTSKSK